MDACGITRALDAIGERWALPVARELIFGPRRYSDLAATMPGVSTNILGARLRELVAAGVLVKRRLPPPAPATVYELTAWGAGLEPALIALGRWAAHTPVDLERQAFSASSLALSLKATFDPAAAAGVEADVRMVMGEDVFDAHVRDAEFTIGRAVDATSGQEALIDRRTETELRVSADPKTLATLIHQRLDPARAAAEGLVGIDGSSALMAAFVRCFTLPRPPMEGSS